MTVFFAARHTTELQHYIMDEGDVYPRASMSSVKQVSRRLLSSNVAEKSAADFVPASAPTPATPAPVLSPEFQSSLNMIYGELFVLNLQVRDCTHWSVWILLI